MSGLRRIQILLAVTPMCLSGAALALSPGDTVDNFRLVDQTGASHELYYLSDMKAVVLVAQGNGCDASRQAASSLEELRAKYQPQGVEFLLINSNLKDTREAIAKEIGGAKTPVLIDNLQLIGESLGMARNGEALVINPQGWKVVYHGAVNAASDNYIADALDATLSGAAVKTVQTNAAGCTIAMPERDKRKAHEKISYEKTIAPMLADHCVTCHREGGIGPWQMSSYEMVRGFAPMIREVVRTQRMPPWHADPHYDAFSNDRSLTQGQVKTLVHWIEAGAPRGTGDDPLKQVKKDWPEWQLGKPDLVIEMPQFNVPATGIIPYQMVTVENPLDHDVWVRAVDFLPGARANLHHIIASIGGERVPPRNTEGGGGSGAGGGFDASRFDPSNLTPQQLAEFAKRARDRNDSEGSLADYVPGAEPLRIPEESGILLKKGAKFSFQSHYTTNGKEAVDVTRMGLYFMKEPPKYRYRAAIMANPLLKIPANTKEYMTSATSTFQKEILVYSVHPHSHFRGKSAKFVAVYPDGHEEVLLNVPKYDFNWQTTYELKTPKVLPAGTKVVYTGVFDNSTQNKANPDPNRVVPWGQQTWDEMLYGVIRFRYLSEDANQVKTASTAGQ